METKRPPPRSTKALEPRRLLRPGRGHVEQQHQVVRARSPRAGPPPRRAPPRCTGRARRGQRRLHEEGLVPVAHRVGEPFTTSALSPRGTCSTKARRSSSASASAASDHRARHRAARVEADRERLLRGAAGGHVHEALGQRGLAQRAPRASRSFTGCGPKFRTVKRELEDARPGLERGLDLQVHQRRGWAAPRVPGPRRAAPPPAASARPSGPFTVGGGASSRSRAAVKSRDHHQALARRCGLSSSARAARSRQRDRSAVP